MLIGFVIFAVAACFLIAGLLTHEAYPEFSGLLLKIASVFGGMGLVSFIKVAFAQF